MDSFAISRIVWVTVITSILLCNFYSAVTGQRTFRVPNSEGSFINFEMDPDTNSIYIGASNKILKLNRDLVLEYEVSTGPELDNAACLPTGECTYGRQVTDNVNQVLVVDTSANRLISCGSVLQGSCQLRRRDDLSLIAYPKSEPHHFIAANSMDGSTYAFIAPGPSDQGEVLYVGVSRTDRGLFSNPPTVSSRTVAADSNNINIFKFASSDEFSEPKIDMNPNVLSIYPNFNIKYVYGFSSGFYSYFVTVQPESYNVPNGPLLSKIVRICHDDNKYHSYIELPLMCSANSVNYNLVQAAYIGKPGAILAGNMGVTPNDDVLFAVFSKSQSSSDNPTSSSALCVYTIKDINRAMKARIQDCFNGNGNLGIDWSTGTLSTECRQSNLPINDDFCGFEVNHPMGGTMPIPAQPVYSTNSATLTAVTSLEVQEYTVVFLGTNRGHLKKVVVTSGTSGQEYEDLTVVASSAVLPSMYFTQDKNYIYVATQRQVTLVPVENCGQYSTCGECLGVRDPYCGWCVLDNKCSRRSECSDADITFRWATTLQECPAISVNPGFIPRTQGIVRVTITGQNIPALTGGHSYSCVFGNFATTSATVVGTQLFCNSPPASKIPAITGPRDNLVSDLFLLASETNQKFVKTNFTFYECNVHASCYSCTSSTFNCDWCIYDNVCTHRRTDVCRYVSNSELVLGNDGPDSCPQILPSEEETLIPEGVTTEIVLKAANLPIPKSGQLGFQCVLDIEGNMRRVQATVLDDQTLQCQAAQYFYSRKVLSLPITLSVEWNGHYIIDNPRNAQVFLYNCSVTHTSCGVCHKSNEKFQCGWCHAQEQCTIRDQCPAMWLDRLQTCPNPRVLQFTPVAGPVEGGTIVTMRGENLGKQFSQVDNNVYVAGIACQTLETGFIPEEQLTCETGGSTQGIVAGPIQVKVDQYNGRSNANFSYVNSVILSVSPTRGPKSGGSRVTITGQHMNAGSTITATVAGQDCQVMDTTSTTAVCTTSPSTMLASGGVRMTFDRAIKVNNNIRFEYVVDPTIIQILTDKTIKSGGLPVQVMGTNLFSVQQPRMTVTVGGQTFTGEPCVVKTENIMECPSPGIVASRNATEDNPIQADFYGFIMDGVLATRNLSQDSSLFTPYLYYPDPIFYPFEDGEEQMTENLIIRGENLLLVIKEEDITVLIGNQRCNVTSLAKDLLTCRPPEAKPARVEEDGGLNYGAQPQVLVLVGDLEFFIGYLDYSGAGINFPLEAQIGLGVAAGLALVVIMIILIVYRRKSKESDRVLKKMQMQMDILESRVARECKEAFAELQTDITELTNDLEGGGIPFLDYRNYTMRVLFPGCDDHPVLRDLEVPGGKAAYMEKGLKQFGQLINNKTFLVLFIRTLEEQKNFTMRDRCNVASLVMVALQGRMDYATDILKALLAQLIDRTVLESKNPKLLMRRTESVAEKMLTNWMSFMLYKFLRECAGEPLYMLFRAIKQQVEKGPVDTVTGEARYSLSEEKLIRQQIEYKILTVNVVGVDDSQPIPVKVLDCDTITQVKEKLLDAIYRSTPFSYRPHKDDVDLGLFHGISPLHGPASVIKWRQGRLGRLTLQDDDLTSKPEGEWKRINTLSHYQVPDGAIMALVPRQQTGYFNLSGFSGLSALSTKSLTKNPYADCMNVSSPGLSRFPGSPASRSTSPIITPDHMENGIKLWHLVKHHDQDMQREGDRGSKMVSEIYLTRLLATKGTLQKFVDDLFETIFSTAHRGSTLPLAIKYLFDFLDEQAERHAITDPSVIHTWKSNSLPLRFWINLIKNPNFVFDIYKSNTVDACLSVIAQTFMDSCSISDHRLGKDSPSSKLLYAKDIPQYKNWVNRYYQDIQAIPPISDQDMNAVLAEESRLHYNEYNTISALHELYSYANKYSEELLSLLEMDDTARKFKLAYKLEQVASTMAGEV
ncbi:plexin-A2-like isoform X5 [Branchiostoma lanceolatum]|uniref:plexin-A2-like isoform X5 n=1 Tax=Branchiostoma lanceolatum TaxID=7740 RepID=UPI00345587D2